MRHNIISTNRLRSVTCRPLSSLNARSHARWLMTFEGNTDPISDLPEERMSRVFGGRLKGEPPSSTSRMLASGCREIAGVQVPAKPIVPDNCCMSGCVNCVWEIYNEDVREWRRKRQEAVDRIKNTKEIWPASWFPPLTKLDIQNVAPELKAKKLELDKQYAKEEQEQTRIDMATIFPPRSRPLPASVVEAKKRNLLKKKQEARKKATMEAEENEVWNDIPVYIKAFAEFERQKKLRKEKAQQH